MNARYQILAEGGVWDFTNRRIVRPNKSASDWQEYQAALTGGETPLPADAAGQLDLEAARAAKIEEINTYAAGRRNQVVRGRSVAEMASWAMKLQDALAVVSAQPSPFAALLPALGAALGLPKEPLSVNAALGAVRGISEAEHAAKVLAQAGQLLVMEVAIDALRGKHADAVGAMTDVRDIVMYDWLAGWPGPGG